VLAGFAASQAEREYYRGMRISVSAAMGLVVLVTMILPSEGLAQPQRVFIGDQTHPVVSGEAWLIANRWGAYPGVLVASIQNGKLEPRSSIEYPPYWEQAFDYKLLLAVADHPVGPPALLLIDDAYLTVAPPEYLRQFSVIYLSPPLPASQLGRDWPTALERIGHIAGSDLILAPPTRRTIRLLYPDGRPLANAKVPIILYGSRENHCGVPVGIDLGTFATNRRGELALVATSAPLAVLRRYYKVETGGPAGAAFSARGDWTVGGEPAITVKQLWTLPEHEYVVRLRTKESQPVAHAHLTACMNFEGCGAGCGPIRAPESDATGTIRFREGDLRGMRSITVVDADGKERNLTDSEMHDLLTTHHLGLRWD
jgi:hypothetical protein